MLLALLLSALVAASEPGEDTALAAAPAELLAELAEYRALRIDGPGHPADQKETDEALGRQIVAKVKALQAIEAQATAIAQSADRDKALAAQLVVGLVYEDLAEALLTSRVPSYLTEDQTEIYRMTLEDKAYAQREKAAAVYLAFQDQAFAAAICDERTRFAHDRLAAALPEEHPPLTESLPPPARSLKAAHALLECRDFARAAEAFRRSSQDEPAARLGLAVALRHSGDTAGAEALYETLLAEAPGDEDIAINAAILYADAEKYGPALSALQGFARANKRRIDRSHEVYARIAAIEQAQAEAEAREAARRSTRICTPFADLKRHFATLKGDLQAYAACPAMIEAGIFEDAAMLLEQIQPVIDAEEIDMASAVRPFVDDLQAQIDALKPQCPRP